MKLSDYVFEFLKNKGVRNVFMLSGGGIMHLVDSLGRSGIKYICCHHEQAAAIAAQAATMYDEQPAVCLATTGPGGTNTLTGCAAAYVDSTPEIYITGQVKTADFASLRNVRQFGAQENDIISMAKPVTKYAVLVTDAGRIRYELEKAYYIATHGRKGPVWLDIPLDIQAAEISPEELEGYTPEEDDVVPSDEIVKEIAKVLAGAKRPLLLVGQGAVAAGAYDKVKELVRLTKIPVVTTWRVQDLMGFDEEGFYGSPGLQAPRYSNIIVQNCDALLVLGSRLDNMITAFNEEHFAFNAKRMIVDTDENEINKLNMPGKIGVTCDVGVFLEKLLAEPAITGWNSDLSKWIASCNAIKERFPILKEKQDKTEFVDLYQVTMSISENCKEDDVIVISSTSRCNTAGHIAFKHKKGQKTISSMGMGSMGFAIPSAVGAYFQSGKRVVVIEGDGSLQLNIQELETIKAYGVDAKMFIFDNRGYAAITTMQDRNFDSFYVGSNEKSGLFMPDTGRIADAYQIPFFKIENESEIADTVKKVMQTEGPVICEIRGSLYFDEIPKCISSVNPETGKRESAVLENPYPFLSSDELEEIMTFMKQ